MKGYLTMVMFTVLAVAASAALVSGAHAQGVLSEWNHVQAPPAPELHQVTIDSAKTALLIMDLWHSPGCFSRVPDCPRDIPHVRMLLDQARSHNMLVVYSEPPETPRDAAAINAIARRAGEPIVGGRGGNRFYNTNLNDILKEHGINTVITCGIVANGVVLFTASAAAARGYHVIVPVDCMPALSDYAEQSVVWGIANDPGLAPPQAFGAGPAAGGPPPGYATLTSSDMIHFR